MHINDMLVENDPKSGFQEMHVFFGASAQGRMNFLREGLNRNQNGSANMPTKDALVENFGAGMLQMRMGEKSDVDAMKHKLNIDGDWKEFEQEFKLTFVPRALSYFYLPA